MRTGVIVVAVALGVACEAPVQQMPPARPAGVRVVDLIPRSLSGETWQDAEPFLALYDSNPKLMAASAFTPNPGGSTSATAPIFVSNDGGDSWTLRNTLPSESMTADITHAVGGTPPVLYAGIMKVPGFPLNELKANDLCVPAHRNPQYRGAEWPVHPARRGTGSHRIRRVLRLALERGSGCDERRRRGARR